MSDLLDAIERGSMPCPDCGATRKMEVWGELAECPNCGDEEQSVVITVKDREALTNAKN